MKRLVLSILIIFSGMSYTKEIPVIKAEIGHVVDFSEESQNFFNIVYKENFEEKNKLTKAEKNILQDRKFRGKYIENKKYSDFYSGQKLEIWQVLGDLEKNLDFYPYPYKIQASSYLKSENTNNYLPVNISDNSFKTAWIEGANGYGKKEWIECSISKKYDGDANILGIYIFNGYVKSMKAFWKIQG